MVMLYWDKNMEVESGLSAKWAVLFQLYGLVKPFAPLFKNWKIILHKKKKKNTSTGAHRIAKWH